MRKSSTSSLWRMRNLSWAAGQGRTRYRSVFSKGRKNIVHVASYTRGIEPLQPPTPLVPEAAAQSSATSSYRSHPNNHQTVQTATNQQTARGWNLAFRNRPHKTAVRFAVCAQKLYPRREKNLPRSKGDTAVCRDGASAPLRSCRSVAEGCREPQGLMHKAQELLAGLSTPSKWNHLTCDHLQKSHEGFSTMRGFQFIDVADVLVLRVPRLLSWQDGIHLLNSNFTLTREKKVLISFYLLN